MAGIVHIVSVFALPEVAPKNAFARLSALAKPGRMTLLPPARPGPGLVPFEDPAIVQGVCLYDVSQMPLRLRASVDSSSLMTLSFRTAGGRIFYAMTDRAAVRGKIDILILSPEELDDVEANDDDDAPPQELRLISRTPTGFVLVNSLVEHSGDRAAAEARLKAVSCEPEKPSEN